MTNHKDYNNHQDKPADTADKNVDKTETTTTSLKRNVTFYSYKVFNESIHAHKNNGYDDSTSLSSVFSTLINTWLRSGLHLDIYLVLVNYIANIKTGKYSDLTPPFPPNLLDKINNNDLSDSELDTVMKDKDNVAMTIPANLYNELQKAQYLKTRDMSLNSIYRHLALGWLKSGLHLIEYCSLMKYAQNLHLWMLKDLKDYVKF